MIVEPMTLATDLLLAAAVSFWGCKLLGAAEGRWPVRLWAGAFFASAAAAFCGGIHHGFRPWLAPEVLWLLWKGTVLLVGGGSFLLLAAVAFAFFAGWARRLLLALAGGKFLLYAGWMLGHDAFIYVIADYGFSLLAVLLLQLAPAARRSGSAGWIAAGILLSFAAAGIQAGKISPHPQFNHNDLYHVVQVAAFYLLYKGGALLADAGSTRNSA